MVRPANFGPNPETAESNAFQNPASVEDLAAIRSRAVAEFDMAVATLRKAGVKVVVVQDEFRQERTDAVFPNNWISMHNDGRVFLYPMQSPARRTERRQEVWKALEKEFQLGEVCDLSASEQRGAFLEGTGSMVLDYQHKVVYACRSVRTSEELAREQAERLGFRLVMFDAADRHGKPVYHTNVLMCLGTAFCVICLECIPEGVEKSRLTGMLSSSGYMIVDISFRQMEKFAGNMLEIQTGYGKPALVMSQTAFNALTVTQVNILKKYVNLIAIEIPVIEKYGGGSARCMMAGIHLPRKA